MYKFGIFPKVDNNSVISLRPCLNSLTYLVQKYGINFYNSTEYLVNFNNLKERLNKNKNEIKNILNEKGLNIDIENNPELILIWDSYTNKEELIKNKIEKEKELERLKEIERQKEIEKELELERLVNKQLELENNKIIFSDDENYDIEDDVEINQNNNENEDNIITTDSYDKWNNIDDLQNKKYSYKSK